MDTLRSLRPGYNKQPLNVFSNRSQETVLLSDTQLRNMLDGRESRSEVTAGAAPLPIFPADAIGKTASHQRMRRLFGKGSKYAAVAN